MFERDRDITGHMKDHTIAEDNIRRANEGMEAARKEAEEAHEEIEKSGARIEHLKEQVAAATSDVKRTEFEKEISIQRIAIDRWKMWLQEQERALETLADHGEFAEDIKGKTETEIKNRLN